MANIIFAERENAGLHAPTLKMRQRLQSAPEKQGKSPMKPFSTPLPSGRKAFGCLNVQVSTPAVNKQEQKLLKKQPPVYQEETKVQHAPQANTEYPEPEKFIPYDPLEYLRYDIPEDLIPLSKLALPGLACFTQAPDLCEDDFQELAPLPNPPPVNVNLKGSGGLTPLHVACMHSQYMVIKLLVGAFSANVDAMDYNGKRPWQYLKEDAPPEMKELLGTWDDEHSWGCAQNINRNANNNCAGAINLTACDEVDGGEAEEVNNFNRTKTRGGWRLGSLKKLLPSFSFLGSKT